MSLPVLNLIVSIVFSAGIRVMRPAHRRLVERFDRYRRFAQPGFRGVIPNIDRMY